MKRNEAQHNDVEFTYETIRDYNTMLLRSKAMHVDCESKIDIVALRIVVRFENFPGIWSL